jgi:hypothetical protein
MKTIPSTLGLILAATVLIGPVVARDTVTAKDAKAAAALQATDGLPSYELMDSDRDGIVSAPELGTYLRWKGDRSQVSTATLGKQAIARLDRNADGRLLVSESQSASRPARTTLEWQTLSAPDGDRVATDGDDD